MGAPTTNLPLSKKMIEECAKSEKIHHGEIELSNKNIRVEIYDSKVKYLVEIIERVVSGVRLVVTRRTEWDKV